MTGPSSQDRPIRVAIAGNPNVGKTTLFNRLTGAGGATAHYAGTTLESLRATTMLGGRPADVVDVPGAYALSGSGRGPRAARGELLGADPDVVIAVVDATNLARNLILTLQILDLGVPVVVALNLVDEAGRAGIRVDPERLAASLETPVVLTVGTTGEGVELLASTTAGAAGSARDKGASGVEHGEWLQSVVAPVEASCAALSQRPYGLTARSLAALLLEGAPELLERIAGDSGGADVLASMDRSRMIAGERPAVRLARERHAAAARLSAACSTADGEGAGGLGRLWRASTSPVTGVPLLAAVLASLFAFLFAAGDAMATGFSALWRALASPGIQAAVHAVAGDGALAQTLLWGLDAGVEASLAIGLPYILTFYVLLGILEDSGYLNAVAFLADRTMHRVGLHGRAIVPLVAAAGCNVPAVLATRDLPTRRERTIAATLVTFVPCSARTAVILGAVARYIGWRPALGVFAVVAIVTVTVGVVLGRMLPGSPRGLVMEVFPFRRPSVRGVLRKAWGRFAEFLVVATPIVVVGSMVLGGLYETGWLFRLTAPLAPIVEVWLGLPAVAGLTLLVGILRKELALQLLATLAIASVGRHAGDLLAFMGPTDLFVYALVNTLAIPCISTVTVLAGELGWRRAAAIVGLTVSVALLVGGIFARLLPLLGWS
ncbi:MAG: ferrous iron transport protein B [Coriobacteriia bacterium]